MPTSSSFSISLHTLVRFRHGDSAEWDRLVQQLQALDVLEDFKAWDAQMRRQLPEDPYIARFVAWLTRAWPWILQCHGLEIVNPNDAFLRDELRAFIARTDANAQAREALLDSLQDEKGQKIPPETRGGIYELCFLPQVIFEWCITTTEWHCQAREDAVKLQQHARSLYNQAQGSFLMPATDKERLREKRRHLRHFSTSSIPLRRSCRHGGNSYGLRIGSIADHLYTTCGH